MRECFSTTATTARTFLAILYTSSFPMVGSTPHDNPLGEVEADSYKNQMCKYLHSLCLPVTFATLNTKIIYHVSEKNFQPPNWDSYSWFYKVVSTNKTVGPH